MANIDGLADHRRTISVAAICDNCAHGLILPAGRIRPMKGRLGGVPRIIECRRMPLYNLKLPMDWCGEHRSKAPTGQEGL